MTRGSEGETERMITGLGGVWWWYEDPSIPRLGGFPSAAVVAFPTIPTVVAGMEEGWGVRIVRVWGVYL